MKSKTKMFNEKGLTGKAKDIQDLGKFKKPCNQCPYTTDGIEDCIVDGDCPHNKDKEEENGLF